MLKKNSHKRRPTRCSNRNVTRFNIFLTETKTIAVILMRSRRETQGTIWHVAKRRSWTYSEVFLFRVSRRYQLNDKRFNFTYYWQCNDNDNNDKGIHSNYICGDEERSNEVGCSQIKSVFCLIKVFDEMINSKRSHIFGFVSLVDKFRVYTRDSRLFAHDSVQQPVPHLCNFQRDTV